MRSSLVSAACLAAALASLVSAAAFGSSQVVGEGVLERDVSSPHLAVQARQASSNASSTSASASASSSSSTGSSSSSSSSSTTNGGSVNITESPTQDPPTGCSMTNNLSTSQSASWTDTSASTCCTNSTATTCFFRLNADVSGASRCTIPNCEVLEAGKNETGQMAGFKPLSSSNGAGQYNNTFMISPNGAVGGRGMGGGQEGLLLVGTALLAAGTAALALLQ